MDLTISPYARLPLPEPNNRNDLGLGTWLKGDREEGRMKQQEKTKGETLNDVGEQQKWHEGEEREGQVQQSLLLIMTRNNTRL